MSDSNIDKEYDTSGAKYIPPEFYVAKSLKARFDKENYLKPDDRNTLAYRVAEIMVHSKELSQTTLPRILGESESLSVEEEVLGLRMALIHLKDLIDEFEGAFMDSMMAERDPSTKEDGDWLDPDNWDPNDLADGASDPSMN